MANCTWPYELSINICTFDPTPASLIRAAGQRNDKLTNSHLKQTERKPGKVNI